MDKNKIDKEKIDKEKFTIKDSREFIYVDEETLKKLIEEDNQK